MIWFKLTFANKFQTQVVLGPVIYTFRTDSGTYEYN